MDGLCLTFDDSNGVLQPYKHLGWWKWMYRTSPYTYIIEGIVGQGEAFRPMAYLLFVLMLFIQRSVTLGSRAQASNTYLSVHLGVNHVNNIWASTSTSLAATSRIQTLWTTASTVHTGPQTSSWSPIRISSIAIIGATSDSCGFI
jgi:hypothetical protein